MYQYKFNHVLCLCSDTSGGEGIRAIRELKQRPSTGSEAKTLDKTSSGSGWREVDFQFEIQCRVIFACVRA